MAIKVPQELELKNYIHCSNLYSIEPNYDDLTLSQRLFKQVIIDFYLLVIKGNLTSFDDQLFLIIKKNINKYYPKVLVDDSQKLISYLLSGVHSFIKKFPLNKFYPILTQINKPYVLDSNEILLNYDLVFVQNNKLKFIHGIVFSSIRLETFVNTDSFNHLKLKCLSELYFTRRYGNPATYLHVLNLPTIEFNNKNLKTFPLKQITLSERDINQTYIDSLSLYLEELKDPKPFIPKPSCFFTNCPKRKECQSGSNTW